MTKNIGAKLLFLGLGLAAGAAIGILYAPDEGRQTRGKLSYQLKRYSERLSDLIGRMKEVQEQAGATAQTESQKVMAETKQEAERLLGHVEALMEQIKEKKGNA